MKLRLLRRLRSLRWSGPLGITGIYFLIGTAWILLSDHAISLVAPSPEAYARLQTYKGTLYVVITTLLIFGLLNRYARAASDAVASLKKTQQRLTTTLHEKEVLIRELHHRVRNNLQILTALVRLSGDRSPGTAFQRRLETLSAMQDAIGPHLAGEPVDLETVLHESVRLVAADASRRNVLVTEQYQPCQILPDTGIRIGLILSELATNAVEHGCPRDHSGGRVEVAVKRTEDGLSLNVRDFGTGTGEEPHPIPFDGSQNHVGPGLQITAALVEQNGGSLTFSSAEPGTHVNILFPWQHLS